MVKGFFHRRRVRFEGQLKAMHVSERRAERGGGGKGGFFFLDSWSSGFKLVYWKNIFIHIYIYRGPVCLSGEEYV